MAIRCELYYIKFYSETFYRMLLFIQHYADVVPHPYGQAIGEELFQSGLIPSDTDFRIFRDFGQIPGMFKNY